MKVTVTVLQQRNAWPDLPINAINEGSEGSTCKGISVKQSGSPDLYLEESAVRIPGGEGAWERTGVGQARGTE